MADTVVINAEALFRAIPPVHRSLQRLEGHIMDMHELADRVAIRNLIDRFSLAVTVRDRGAISSVFTEDAEWRVGQPPDIFLNGAGKIGEGIVTGLGNFEFLVQMVHSVVIDLAGERATARSVIQEVGRLVGGASGMQMLGIYHDELRRADNGWRFARRFFEPICLDTAAPGGAFVDAAVGRTGLQSGRIEASE
jgi:hypothetical protein